MLSLLLLIALCGLITAILVKLITRNFHGKPRIFFLAWVGLLFGFFIFFLIFIFRMT